MYVTYSSIFLFLFIMWSIFIVMLWREFLYSVSTMILCIFLSGRCVHKFCFTIKVIILSSSYLHFCASWVNSLLYIQWCWNMLNKYKHMYMHTFHKGKRVTNSNSNFKIFSLFFYKSRSFSFGLHSIQSLIIYIIWQQTYSSLLFFWIYYSGLFLSIKHVLLTGSIYSCMSTKILI